MISFGRAKKTSFFSFNVILMIYDPCTSDSFFIFSFVIDAIGYCSKCFVVRMACSFEIQFIYPFLSNLEENNASSGISYLRSAC